jgi:Na+/H+-dicarboxylate symporter
MSSTETQEKSITSNLTSQILIAMVLGFGSCNTQYDFSRSSLIFSNNKIFATVFIRLVQMIIAPLVLQH